MQIALLAVLILGIPVHFMIDSGVFLATLVILFIFAILYPHFKIAFATMEHPDNIHERHFEGPDEGRAR